MSMSHKKNAFAGYIHRIFFSFFLASKANSSYIDYMTRKMPLG
jgi:hypothetical protein